MLDSIYTSAPSEPSFIQPILHFRFQMIILPFIPILALIVQTSIILQEILDYKAEVADIEAQVSVDEWAETLISLLSFTMSHRNYVP